MCELQRTLKLTCGGNFRQTFYCALLYVIVFYYILLYFILLYIIILLCLIVWVLRYEF